MSDYKEYGEFPDDFDLEAFLTEAGAIFDENSTGEFIFSSCPFCGKSKKFYFNASNASFNCFAGSCQKRSGPYFGAIWIGSKLLNKPFDVVEEMIYGKKGQETIHDILKNTSIERLEFDIHKRKDKKFKNAPQDLLIPDELELLNKEKHPKPWQYLVSRGYTDDVIKKLDLLYLPYESFGEAWNDVCKKRFPDSDPKNLADDEKMIVNEVVRYFERVIFPLYVDGKVKGFVARDITGTKEPKVLNSRGGFRNFYFWNYDNAKKSKEIIICEGNSSAIKCGVSRSVALLGKTMSKNQRKLLKKTAAKKVIICFDVGTDEDVKSVNKLLSLDYLNEIYYVELPPVIELKDSVITEELVERVNKLGNLSLKLVDKSNIELKSSERKDLQLLTLAESDEFDLEEQKALLYISKKAEYKDPGDYTEKEMDNFIKRAKKVQRSIFDN